jgi:hypothetical protein
MKEGDVVIIQGLESATGLNGQSGKILPGRKGERFVIALDSGAVSSPQNST